MNVFFFYFPFFQLRNGYAKTTKISDHTRLDLAFVADEIEKSR